MAKHDKHGNPSSREDRGYRDGFREQDAWNDGNDRQADEGLPEADDGTPRGAGLGKEVKIGLAVVAVLLVVLGTVVALKLRGPSGETTAAADGKNDADEKAVNKEPAFPGSSSKDSPPVVQQARAGAGSPGSTNPRGKTLDDSDRSVVSDSAGGRDGGPAKPPTLSFMPPKTDRGEADRPAGRRSDDPFSARTPSPGGRAETIGTSPAGAPPSVMPGSDPRGTAERPGGRSDSLVRPAAPRGMEPGAPVGPRSRDLFAPLAATGDRGGTASSTETNHSPASRETPPQAAAPPTFGGSQTPFQRLPIRTSDVAGSAGLESRETDPGSGIGSMPRQPLGPPRSRPDAGLAPDGTYVVQPNETFYSIAEKLYGTSAYYQALTEHNRRLYPSGRLRPNDKILAPTADELAKTYPALCPKPDRREEIERRNTLVGSPSRARGGRVYVVQEGDTLYDIARYELGKPQRWAEIYELNRDVIGKQFDYLTPGMQLALPDRSPSPGPITQRPSSGFNR